MFFDKRQRLIDRSERRCASHHPAFTLLGDKPCRDETAKVKRER